MLDSLGALRLPLKSDVAKGYHKPARRCTLPKPTPCVRWGEVELVCRRGHWLRQSAARPIVGSIPPHRTARVFVPRLRRIIPADRERPGREVAPELAGDVVVSLEELRAKLGQTAFAVWWQMLICRSEGGGQFHGTVKRLAAAVGKTERAVRHGLARLKQSAIVTDGGFARLEVYDGHKVVERTVYTRTVRGAVLDDSRATVPRLVALWLGQANAHGGPRPGSGPKKFKTVGTGEPPTSRAEHLHIEFETGTRPSESSVQDGRTIVSSSRGDTPCFVAYGNDALPSAARAVAMISEQDDAEPRALLRQKPRVAPLPITVGGPIPPYPGTSLVRPALKPPPPALPRDADDYELARALVDAYNGACTARLGARCSVLKSRKSLEGSRYYRGLVAAAKLLRDKKIAPGAWAAFWLDAQQRTKRPPIQVYFSEKFVGDQKKRWVFRKARPHYGHRAVFGDAHKALIERWEEMRAAIRQSGAATEAEVERIVALHFPPGQWALMLEAAQKEAKSTQAAMHAAVADGEFIW